LIFQAAFCVPKHVAPFARTAFALPAKNPSVQFQNFLSIVEWLAFEATGSRSAFSLDKFDDPNTSVNKMMLSLRGLGFSLDFPVGKLKTGHGEATCNVLDFLCDKALGRRGFVWAAPTHEAPAEVEDAEVDEDADLGGELDDDVEAAEDEDEGLFLQGRAASSGTHEESFDGEAEAHQLIANTIDPLVWKTELERVGPRLKASGASLGKEWRAHIEQTKAHEKTIQAVLPAAQGHMKSISAQIKDAVEKMRSKEMSLNNQLEPIRADYEELAKGLKATRDKHAATQASVGSLTNAMGSIQEQLDELKEDMEGRENSATDTSPLVNLKAALVSIRGDVQQFDLRIGVVGHTLMQAKLKVAKTSRGTGGKPRKNDAQPGDEDRDDFGDEDGAEAY
jgi:estrogen-related receptor beta like 1